MALLAALCDVVPVLGIIVATLPAVAVALTVSPQTALAVLLLYASYHVLENYVDCRASSCWRRWSSEEHSSESSEP